MPSLVTARLPTLLPKQLTHQNHVQPVIGGGGGEKVVVGLDDEILIDSVTRSYSLAGTTERDGQLYAGTLNSEL